MAGAVLKQDFSAGKRFGARYGRSLRNKFVAIENLKNREYKCPSCHYPKVQRLAVGIWHCKKCDVKFTGKAYTPEIKGKLQEQVMEQFGLSKAQLEAAETRSQKLEEEREQRRKKGEAERLAKEQAAAEQAADAGESQEESSNEEQSKEQEE